MLSTLLLALAPGVASAWSAQALSTSAAKPATSFQNVRDHLEP